MQRPFKKRRPKVHHALFLACALTQTASGDTFFLWKGGAATNDWGQAANWNAGIAPPNDGSADIVFTDGAFGSVKYVFPNLDADYSIYTLAFLGSDGFTLTSAGGFSLTLGAGDEFDFTEFSDAAESVIQFPVLLGANQSWSFVSTAGPIDFAGGLNTNGHTLTVTGGGTPRIIGNISGSGGLTVQTNLTLTGSDTYTGDTKVNADGSLTIGAAASLNGTDIVSVASGSTLNVATGGLVTTATVSISGGGGLNISGGTLNNSGGTVNIGDSSAVANFTMTAGTLSSNELNFGGIASTKGAGSQSGGLLAVGQLNLGNNTGTSNTYTLSGAGVISAADIGVGEAAVSTFIQSGGTITLTTHVELGNSPTGTGTYSLSGGVINTPIVLDGAGSSTFDFNGGTLASTVSNSTFFQGLTTANVQLGGAVINTNGFNITIAQNLLHDTTKNALPGDGGLTKLGAGTLTLTGSNTYNGATTVSAGTIVLPAGGSLNNSNDLAVLAGAKFTVSGGTAAGPNVEIQLSTPGGAPAAFALTSGTLSTYQTVVGAGGAGTSTFTQTGGYHSTGELALSVGSTGFSTYQLSGNSTLTSIQTDVGYFGNASFSQTGGLYNVSGPLNIADGSNSTSTFTLSSGGVLITSQTIVGVGGSATFTQNGGNHNAFNGVTLAQSAGSNGTYILSSGILTTPGVSGGLGVSTFDFNDGTLQATGNNPNFLQGITNAAIQNGAIIDPNGYTLAISQPIIHDPTPGAPALDGGLVLRHPGTLTLSGSNTYTGGTQVVAGNLIIASPGALPIGELAIGGFAPPAQLTLANNVGPVTVTALFLTGSPTLDLGNNKLLINYGSSDSDPISIVVPALIQGYNAGAWNGPGITSTAAAANPGKFAVGYLDGNQPTDTLAATVGPNELILKYTLAGDAFLENTVGFDDLVVVAQNFGKTGEDWAGGNFTYDPTGSVGFADLVKVAQNFGFSSGVNQSSNVSPLSPLWQTATGASPVPEPATCTLLIAGGAGMAARRSRKRQRKMR